MDILFSPEQPRLMGPSEVFFGGGGPVTLPHSVPSARAQPPKSILHPGDFTQQRRKSGGHSKTKWQG